MCFSCLSPGRGHCLEGVQESERLFLCDMVGGSRELGDIMSEREEKAIKRLFTTPGKQRRRQKTLVVTSRKRLVPGCHGGNE